MYYSHGLQPGEQTVTLPRVEYDQLQADLAHFKYQLAELRRLVFGSRSERFISETDADQLPLFADQQAQGEAPKALQSITYQSRQPPKEKQHPIRALLLAHLPRQEEIIEPEGFRKIGEEVTWILEHTPGKLYVRRIVRPKYVTHSLFTLIAYLRAPCFPTM